MGVIYQNPQIWGEMAPSVHIDCMQKKLYEKMIWNSLYCTHENWNKLIYTIQYTIQFWQKIELKSISYSDKYILLQISTECLSITVLIRWNHLLTLRNIFVNVKGKLLMLSATASGFKIKTNLWKVFEKSILLKNFKDNTNCIRNFVW